jgi:hypothetical protein
MTTINTPSYNASRAKATAVILTALKNTESCLVNTQSSFKISNMEEVKDVGLLMSNTWSALTFSG